MTVADFSVKGQVALITGGSKGIGRAIALALAEHGAEVVISARGQDALDVTKKEIESTGRRCVAVVADLGDDADIRRLHETAVSELGVIDILVNNAGFADVVGLHDISYQSFEKTLRINTWAPIYLAQLCFPAWRERGEGRIINIGSNGGIKPDPFVGAYSASKAGIHMVTTQMAQEWARYGIRANSVCPGLVRTEMAAPMVALLESLGNPHNILHRGADASELAGMVLLLASPAGSYCQGERYMVDGGEVFRPTYEFSIEEYEKMKESLLS
ncbi:MAG: SDR family oxidoreductase [Deltaproteobacteria bacterium]|nr:SDR family oxidoreductase [Deltaproteobacteria bacterium]